MDAWSTVAGVRTMEALSRLPGAIDKLTEAVNVLKNETKPKAEMSNVLEGSDREEFLGQMIDIVEDFLDDFDNDPDEKIIIPSVIDMAKKLNLRVVCEGVETKEQVGFLREVGCDYAQGYFYSKPITQEQFDELLEVV